MIVTNNIIQKGERKSGSRGKSNKEVNSSELVCFYNTFDFSLHQIGHKYSLRIVCNAHQF